MIRYKEGVPQNVLSYPASEALDELEVLFRDYETCPVRNSPLDIVVTSTTDGKHMKTSKHYDIPCNAFDIRFWDLLEAICRIIRAKLGHHYDVVLEPDHIHIEWDPKE